MLNKRTLLAALAILLFLVSTASGRGLQEAPSAESSKATVRSHPAAPLFKNKQGKQKTSAYYDPATQTVTLNVIVQTPAGYFIPDLHPDNFAVFENGVRPQNVQVHVEHAPVKLGLLMEYGSRFPSLNGMLGTDVRSAAHQLLSTLTPADRVQAWTYGDTVHNLNDKFGDVTDVDQRVFALGDPSFSESNLYDSLLSVAGQMKTVKGNTAIVLLSSGINTFSKATYQDVVTSLDNTHVPVYVVGLTTMLRNHATANGIQVGLIWQKAEHDLDGIATASGGRAYLPENTIYLASIFDDLMENLKVRYVVTFKSPAGGDLNTPRTVRVSLIDPSSGTPLRIVDENGKPIQAVVVAPESYTPAQASRH
jgi:VWFA-related protein